MCKSNTYHKLRATDIHLLYGRTIDGFRRTRFFKTLLQQEMKFLLNPKSHKLSFPRTFTIFFEPTDKRKAVKALKGKHHLTYVSPNIAELRAMVSVLKPEKKLTLSGDMDEILMLATIISQYVDFLILTLGPKGVITVRSSMGQLDARFYQSKPLHKIQSVSGAGDCFASGFIHGILLGQKQSSCITMGTQAAKCALLTKNTVPHNLSLDKCHEDAKYTKLEISSEIKNY